MSFNANVTASPFPSGAHTARIPPQKVSDFVEDTALNLPVPTNGPSRSMYRFNESHSSNTRVRSWLNPSSTRSVESPQSIAHRIPHPGPSFSTIAAKGSTIYNAEDEETLLQNAAPEPVTAHPTGEHRRWRDSLVGIAVGDWMHSSYPEVRPYTGPGVPRLTRTPKVRGEKKRKWDRPYAPWDQSLLPERVGCRERWGRRWGNVREGARDVFADCYIMVLGR